VDFGESIGNAQLIFFNNRGKVIVGHSESFQKWMFNTYGISVFRKDGSGAYRHSSKGRWFVHEYQDAELVTLFLLEYA
jgi:hypothetical protein